MSCHGSVTIPVARKMCGRSFGRRPVVLVRSFGSWPNVRKFAPAIVLNCAASAAALLVAWRPYARE
jgi:hypothetical protein